MALRPNPVPCGDSSGAGPLDSKLNLPGAPGGPRGWPLSSPGLRPASCCPQEQIGCAALLTPSSKAVKAASPALAAPRCPPDHQCMLTEVSVVPSSRTAAASTSRQVPTTGFAPASVAPPGACAQARGHDQGQQSFSAFHSNLLPRPLHQTSRKRDPRRSRGLRSDANKALARCGQLYSLSDEGLRPLRIR